MQRAGQPLAFGHIETAAARAEERALVVVDHRGLDEHIEGGAVALEPLDLCLARPQKQARILAEDFSPGRRQQPQVRLAVQLLPRVAEGVQQCLVEGHEAAGGVESEIEHRRTVVEIAVALLQPVQVLAALLKPSVRLGQLLRAVLQLAFDPGAVGDVLEMTAKVPRLPRDRIRGPHVGLQAALGPVGQDDAKGDVVGLAVAQGLLQGAAQLGDISGVDQIEKRPGDEIAEGASEPLQQRR